MAFPEQFPALDPGVGNGAALTTLLESSNGLQYGIEIDAHRSQQAHSLGIEVLYAKYGTTVVVSGDFECYGEGCDDQCDLKGVKLLHDGSHPGAWCGIGSL